MKKIKKVKEKTIKTNKYECLFDMYVRCGAGTNYGIKLVKDLVKDEKINATSNNLFDYAILKKGTIYEALEIINNNGIWAKTNSGYICIEGVSKTKYAKEVE